MHHQDKPVQTWTVKQSTILNAEAAKLWQHATSMAGVNFELAPWVRMSVPPQASASGLDDVILGEVAFHSWMLGLGFLPFDRHALCIHEIGPDYRFLEKSTSWLQRQWHHDRQITSVPGGSMVVDKVTFSPKLVWLGPLSHRIVSAVFLHRHRHFNPFFHFFT